MKRLEGEDFEQYKARRAADNILTKMKLAFKYVWYSYITNEKGDVVGRTYVKSRDTLVNSRVNTAPNAPARPSGDQMHKRKVNDEV